METLLDIKNALRDIPDELLGNLTFACGEGCEDEISMIAPEGTGDYEFPKVWDIIDEKYPQLNQVKKLILNIAKAQKLLDEDENMCERLWEQCVTDTFFDGPELVQDSSGQVQ